MIFCFFLVILVFNVELSVVKITQRAFTFMKFKVLIFFFVFFHFELPAQTNIDSLLKVYSGLPNDTASVNKIVKAGKNLMGSDIKAANGIFKMAEQRALKTNDERLLAKVYILVGQSYIRLSEAKMASTYYVKAKAIAEKLNDSKLLGGIHLDLGGMYLQSKESKSALYNYNKALTFCEKDDFDQKGSILGNIGMIYYYLSKEKNETVPDKNLVLKAISYSKQAFDIAKNKLNSERKIVNQGNLLSQEYMDLGKLDSASFYMSESENALLAKPNPILSTSFYFGKGMLLQKQEKFKEAIVAFKESVKYAKIVGMSNMQYESFLAMAYAYQDIKDYKMASEYFDKHIILKDSILNQENFAIAADLQNKYESQKKENEILKLNAENAQKANLNKILFGSLAALLLVAILSYFSFQNRQKLQQLKISELEKDKQLLAAESMIKGQEAERNRIAKDLHDGLGGMLSGVKMSFSNMKENLIMSAENVGRFENSIAQLDTSISELRKIAHNLMPEALVRFGLKEAINDFVIPKCKQAMCKLCLNKWAKTESLKILQIPMCIVLYKNS